MAPLLTAKTGEENVIKKIVEPPELKKHLSDLGFVVGSSIKIVSSMAGNLLGQICPLFTAAWFLLCFLFLGLVRILS